MEEVGSSVPKFIEFCQRAMHSRRTNCHHDKCKRLKHLYGGERMKHRSTKPPWEHTRFKGSGYPNRIELVIICSLTNGEIYLTVQIQDEKNLRQIKNKSKAWAQWE